MRSARAKAPAAAIATVAAVMAGSPVVLLDDHEVVENLPMHMAWRILLATSSNTLWTTYNE